VLDGQGHAIAGLVIDSSVPYAGLFGEIGSGGQVASLRLIGVSVHGQALIYDPRGGVDGGTGGLAGVNQGLVTNCCNTGSASGNGNVGDLVGYNYYGTISGCYSTGSVSGSSYVGGLAGSNGLATISVCFWDIQASGMTTSAAGTGKTTAEMQTAKTFTDAGWDFVGETKNGTADVWWIDEGKDYPRLSWEAHN
jgi:hypothetical protein